MFRKVREGSNTLLWHDRWLGDVPMCRWFSRSFDLSLNKLITVAEMFSLGWEVGEQRGVGGDECGSERRSC